MLREGTHGPRLATYTGRRSSPIQAQILRALALAAAGEILAQRRPSAFCTSTILAAVL